MAQVELVMPKMGESIMEATIIKWVKNVGDTIEAEETILEIATDKVDSEVPSPVSGTVAKILFNEEDTVAVGQVIALIATDGEELMPEAAQPDIKVNGQHAEEEEVALVTEALSTPKEVKVEKAARPSVSTKFYSPLVRNIAQKENVSIEELDQIAGTGLNERVTKKDMLTYIKNRKTGPAVIASSNVDATTKSIASEITASNNLPTTTSVSGNVEIIEMDRMRRLIADHMIMSKKTSPHVTSFVEVDVTEIVNWRNKVKAGYKAKHKENNLYAHFY